jgi:hypothetical protein
VTRLVEFSPNGWLFTLVRVFWIAEVAHILGLLFQSWRLWIDFEKKCVVLNFGRFFSQTHLVTLPAGDRMLRLLPVAVLVSDSWNRSARMSVPSSPGSPDFSWYKRPKPEIMYQMNTKCTKQS